MTLRGRKRSEFPLSVGKEAFNNQVNFQIYGNNVMANKGECVDF